MSRNYHHPRKHKHRPNEGGARKLAPAEVDKLLGVDIDAKIRAEKEAVLERHRAEHAARLAKLGLVPRDES